MENPAIRDDNTKVWDRKSRPDHTESTIKFAVNLESSYENVGDIETPKGPTRKERRPQETSRIGHG